jgi:exosome complex RNA-binding protein Rrp42 (RNase PH superfamily)
VSVDCGAISALSSVAVRVGASFAMCVVKAEVGPTEPEQPALGRVDYSVSFAPFCEQGPDGGGRDEQQQRCRELALQLDDAFDNAVHRRDLCITRGEVCWVLKVDVRLMQLDAYAVDVCSLAAAAALRRVTLPATTLADGTETVETPLRMPVVPVCVTSALALNGTVVLADPSLSEALVSDAHVTVVVDAAKGGALLGVRHHGGFPCAQPALAAIAAVAAGFVEEHQTVLLQS